jgi:hypothetical protein
MYIYKHITEGAAASGALLECKMHSFGTREGKAMKVPDC